MDSTLDLSCALIHIVFYLFKLVMYPGICAELPPLDKFGGGKDSAPCVVRLADLNE